ncbi:MAG TPA: hypothetical protein ENK80_03370 [Rhodobacterales bacterium]|nr:hypothetical protein [Rhodobacterales bacterium]
MLKPCVRCDLSVVKVFRNAEAVSQRRLWRSLKQEAIYLEEFADGFQARRVIRNWMAFYNTERPQSSLECRTPKGSILERSKSDIGGMKQNPDTP